MAETPEEKKLSEVSLKLSQINQTEGVELGNIKALTKTLVDQGKATLLQQEAVAAGEEEARKEAARARKDKAGVQDVNVLNWQETKEEEGGGLFDSLKEMLMMKWSMGGFSLGSLFKKGGLKKLLLGLGTTLFTGIKTAFASVGTGIKGLLGPTLMKFLSPMALITGLVLAVKDGITAMGSSMDWGVGKISAFLGGFFAGEADGGIMNMFKNAGKWALIGAGVGSFIPVIGTLLGGLVGMVIGGILGLIGAKKIAQAFNAVGAWLSEKWSQIAGFVKEIWGQLSTWFSEQWTKVKEFFFSALSWAGEGLSAGWSSLSGFVSEKWEAVKKWFSDLLTFESEGGEKIGIGEKIIELFKKIPEKLIAMFRMVVDKIKNLIPGMEADTEASKYWGITDIGSKDVDTEALKKAVETMGQADLAKLKKGFREEQLSSGLDNAKDVFKIIEQRAAQFAAGGPVTGTGLAMLHGSPSAPELVLDNQAAGIFAQAAQTLAQLQRSRIDLNNQGPAGLQMPTVINNNNNVTNQSQGLLLPPSAVKVQSSNKLPIV